MTEHTDTNRFFWIRGLFGLILAFGIVAVYSAWVKSEEKKYTDFINREWPAHTVTYTKENSPLQGKYLSNLTTDEAGNVWIGTDAALTVVTPQEEWSTLLVNGQGRPVQSVAFDRSGRVWVGSFEGLYVLDPNGQWTTYDEPSRTVYESYTSRIILIDRSDRVWVANDDHLRMFLPDGTKTVYTEENSGLLDDYITALAEDRQGNIWIGTRTQGVAVFEPNGQWKTYPVGGSIVGPFDNWVTALFIDPQDRLWVGTEGGKLSMRSPHGDWTTYNTYRQGLLADPEYYDPAINAFAMDRQGRLWIGTWDSLFALDGDGNWGVFNQVNSALEQDYVRALTVDAKNRLWIATFEKVIVLDLNRPLPQTVSNEWLQRRNRMLIPMKIASGLKSFLLVTFEFFDNFLFRPFQIGYLAVLALILPAAMGAYWGYVKRNRNLLRTSCSVLLVACLGIIFFWMLGIVLALFTYRD
jgi:ligand-binding sensor domain-containing protein